jgi:hypothetical protein
MTKKESDRFYLPCSRRNAALPAGDVAVIDGPVGVSTKTSPFWQ